MKKSCEELAQKKAHLVSVHNKFEDCKAQVSTMEASRDRLKKAISSIIAAPSQDPMLSETPSASSDKPISAS